MGWVTRALGLTLKVPTDGATNWSSGFLADFVDKISAHDHSGSGKGAAIVLDDDQVTTSKIQDANVTVAKLSMNADLPMGSHKITGLSNGSASTDAATVGQLPSGLSTGMMVQWGTLTAPSGFLLCNGASVSTTTYAALHAVIGDRYNTGSLPAGNFSLPSFYTDQTIDYETVRTYFIIKT